jgi:hypothetical protein
MVTPSSAARSGLTNAGLVSPFPQLPPAPPPRLHNSRCRSEKLGAQQAEHEARVARALQRAAAPAFRRSGKPPMPRSTPPRAQAVVERGARDEGAAELAAFLARELL